MILHSKLVLRLLTVLHFSTQNCARETDRIQWKAGVDGGGGWMGCESQSGRVILRWHPVFSPFFWTFQRSKTKKKAVKSVLILPRFKQSRLLQSTLS